MNDFSPHPRAGGPLPATTSDEDTVAVRTRVWCTAVMITVSAFMCLSADFIRSHPVHQ